MKKSIKIAAVALATLPALAFMTACGKDEFNDSGKVNIKGTYQTVDVASYNTTLAEVTQEPIELTSIYDSARIMQKMEIDYAGNIMTLSSDAVIKNATKATTNEGSKFQVISKNKLAMNNETYELNTYVSKGILYVDASSLLAYGQSTGKYRVDLRDTLIGLEAPDPTHEFALNLNDLLGRIPEGEYGNALVLEKAVDGTTTKYKFTVDDQYVSSIADDFLANVDMSKLPVTINSLGDATIYLVFENNNFAGVSLNLSVNLMMPKFNPTTGQPMLDQNNQPIYDPVVVALTETLGKYKGAISMPKFDKDYALMDLSQFA